MTKIPQAEVRVGYNLYSFDEISEKQGLRLGDLESLRRPFTAAFSNPSYVLRLPTPPRVSILERADTERLVGGRIIVLDKGLTREIVEYVNSPDSTSENRVILADDEGEFPKYLFGALRDLELTGVLNCKDNNGESLSLRRGSNYPNLEIIASGSFKMDKDQYDLPLAELEAYLSQGRFKWVGDYFQIPNSK